MKIGIVGLGYVGLPLGLQFARAGVEVLGFDIDPDKVARLNRGQSYIKHIDSSAVAAEVLGLWRQAGITVCCGGILGMGEKESDRAGLLHQLATLNPHPESVPINMLVRVEGTPLAAMPPLDPLEMVRAIATARILMPASRVRLASPPAGCFRERS